MKRWILLLLGTFVLTPSLLASPATYGKGVSIEKATPIATILEKPESWKGKDVRVEGKVVGVCQKRGCWMEIADEGGKRLRVKVEDGVIVFPQEAEGARAVVQGKVQVIDLEKDEYVGWLQHLAEEQGQSFDPAAIGEGPYQLIQIAGTGAEI